MLQLPALLTVRGGPVHDHEAKVTVRFDAGSEPSPLLTISCDLALVDVSLDALTLDVPDGCLPRAAYDAFEAGLREEWQGRIEAGEALPSLKATITAALVHPVDCRARGHSHAGKRALRWLLDGDAPGA